MTPRVDSEGSGAGVSPMPLRHRMTRTKASVSAVDGSRGDAIPEHENGVGGGVEWLEGAVHHVQVDRPLVWMVEGLRDRTDDAEAE